MNPSTSIDDAAPGLAREEIGASFSPLFRNGHLQTIFGRYWPNGFDEERRGSEARLFRTGKDVQVLAHENRPPRGSARGTVLAVHGLTGSSESSYMQSLAGAALARGLNVIRLNVRNCGGTEHLAPTLYHSGLTDDLREVVKQLAPEPLVIVGFSMGGNIALKLAGEWHDSLPAHVRGICGISVPIRLRDCALRLGERRNRIYEIRFLRELERTVQTKQRLMPKLFKSLPSSGTGSIYAFDDRVTAPAFGFRDADDYYEQSSSARFLDRIRVPTLLLQARDDPFIPFQIFEGARIETFSHVRLVTTECGGHVSFLARSAPRFWAQEQACRFAERAFSGSRTTRAGRG